MKIISIVLLSFFGLNTLCYGLGNDFGGGFSVKIDSEHQLFDFYEHQLASFSNPKVEDFGNFSRGITSLNLPGPVAEGLNYKLNEIYLKSTEFANHLYQISTSFSYVFVNSDLKRIEDVGDSLVDTSKLALIPLALRNRESKTIFISKEYFEKLSVNHQIGLILHEVLSHYILDSTSSRARKLNSYLFSKTFSSHNFDQMEAFLVSLGEITTKEFIHTENHSATAFTWGPPRGTNPKKLASYVSYQNFNPLLCENKVEIYRKLLLKNKIGIEEAWAITNKVNESILKNELLRFKPENHAHIVFLINPNSCLEFETNTYDCRGWLASKSNYYVNYYNTDSKSWVKEIKEISYNKYYDFHSLSSHWQQFKELSSKTLKSSDYRCGYTWYELYGLTDQVLRITIGD